MADASGAGRLVYLPDLRIEVGDAKGTTTAHLAYDEAGLVLDVGQPGTLLRCLPGRALLRQMPVPPRELLSGNSIRLTSGGRDLGRASVGSGGRVRFTPTATGAVVLGRAASGAIPLPQRTLLAASAAAALAAAIAWFLRRR